MNTTVHPRRSEGKRGLQPRPSPLSPLSTVLLVGARSPQQFSLQPDWVPSGCRASAGVLGLICCSILCSSPGMTWRTVSDNTHYSFAEVCGLILAAPSQDAPCVRSPNSLFLSRRSQ